MNSKFSHTIDNEYSDTSFGPLNIQILDPPLAVLNFPEEIWARPAPASLSPASIRAAAAEAAAAALRPRSPAAEIGGERYMDEEEMFDMPGLLMDMAEGMMMSPPRLSPNAADDAAEMFDDENLWSYP
ncbi:hypothetical protein ZIOFF_019478 [Zingiber officinale]|uniref:Uncharacterized protein n=1 Tax=Zingiber officinale TaxID=94328 RepID=A0A8J5H7G1_ZINOF|nr:hypothetical protein ZIOFF_019478 [Zingiber officinale]